jgi:hypothetical protein
MDRVRPAYKVVKAARTIAIAAVIIWYTNILYIGRSSMPCAMTRVADFL